MWRNPWWYPPNSPWAQGEKPVPPGPNNPLGTRWMGLSAPRCRHPRDDQRRVDRLLGLARLHPHARARRRVALQPRDRRHAGLHRLGVSVTPRLSRRAGTVGRARRRAARAARLEGRQGQRQGGGASGQAPAPNFTLARIGDPASCSLGLAARQGGRAQLLGLLVRAVQHEAPLARRPPRSSGPGGVVVLGVDVHDFAGDARKFARKYGLDYPIVHDTDNVTSPKYGLTGAARDVLHRPDRQGRRARAGRREGRRHPRR